VFNIGPLEFVVLAIVGLVVVGPDKLPQLARDAARMIRTLRDMATGARQQLREELGPEFADVDLRNLNPRTAVQRAVFGDDVPDFGALNPRRYNPSAIVRDALFGTDEEEDAGAGPVSFEKPGANGTRAAANGNATTANGNATTANGNATTANGHGPAGNGSRPRPRPKPGPGRKPETFDDAT
jgi:sec-independent protein translocase protein TatB